MLINSIGQNFAYCWHGSVLDKKNGIPLPKQTKYWSLCLWSWRWLELFLLEDAFVFPPQVGYSRGSHPHSPWTPCVLWHTTLTTPVRRERAGFSHWADGEQNPRDKREISQRLHAVSCTGILDQLLQGVMKCLKTPSELPFGPFSYRKCGASAFLNSKQVVHWPGSVRSAWAGPTAPWPLVDMNGKYSVLALACDHSTAPVWANATAQIWSAFTHSHQESVLAPSGEHTSPELFPKLILLAWGEHSLVQPLLSAQAWGTAPCPVLSGF